LKLSMMVFNHVHQYYTMQDSLKLEHSCVSSLSNQPIWHMVILQL